VPFFDFLQHAIKGDKMRKKILTMSLVLIMTLSLTACGEVAEEKAELTSAQDIVNGVIVSWAGVRTYQFDMDMTMDIAAEIEGESFEATMAVGSSGALDIENGQMRADMTMNMAAPEEDEIKMEMEMYLIGDMMHVMMDVPEMGPTWVKSEMPEGYWEDANQVKAQIEFVEVSQVEVIGSEKVRGVDCYVLQLTPDVKQLWQMVMQQAAVTGEEMLPPVAEEFLQEMFRSFSVKQWIAKDTYFLTKTEADMALELTPEAMGYPEEEGVATIDIAMSLLAYDYNQPVSITLPPEAKEATEVPKPGDTDGGGN